jgi:hypothetical protein
MEFAVSNALHRRLSYSAHAPADVGQPRDLPAAKKKANSSAWRATLGHLQCDRGIAFAVSVLMPRGPQNGREASDTTWLGRPLAVSSPKTNSICGFHASSPRMLSTIRTTRLHLAAGERHERVHDIPVRCAPLEVGLEVSSISSRRTRFSPAKTSSWMALSVPVFPPGNNPLPTTGVDQQQDAPDDGDGVSRIDPVAAVS